MIILNGGDIIAANSFIGGTIKYLQLGRTQSIRQGQNLVIDQYENVVAYVQKLGSAAGAMEMTAAKAAADRAHQALLDNYNPRSGYDLNRVSAIIDVLDQLLHAFGDELRARVVVALSLRHGDLYKPAKPIFGEAVESAFPKAADDISEAGKCLAVEQSTAAVFHLMRAMEIAVQILSAKLEISNCDREWGKLLSDITQKVEALPRGDERDRWSEIRTYLYHVKQAWRNSTMHPKQTYTLEEASAIFTACRVFMIELQRIPLRLSRDFSLSGKRGFWKRTRTNFLAHIGYAT